MAKKESIRINLIKIAIGIMSFGINFLVPHMPDALIYTLVFLRIYLIGTGFAILIYHAVKKEAQ